MPGLTDARVEELNAATTRLIRHMRLTLDRMEAATDLATGHGFAASLTLDVARINYSFATARMPAFGRIPE